jgi:hypothetical protein
MKKLLVLSIVGALLLLGAFVALSRQAVVRVAVVADMHLGPKVNLRKAEDRWAQVLAVKPDVIVVAGDIAAVDTTPKRMGVKFAMYRRVIAATPASIPVLSLPGNHSVSWRGDTYSYEAWNAAELGPTNRFTVIKGLAIAGLDTNQAGRIDRLFRLSTSGVVVDPLRKFLARHPELPVLVAYHVPAVEWQQGREEFFDVLQGRTVLLIAGHHHDRGVRTYGHHPALREVVTPAFSGGRGWWRDSNHDYSSPGFTLVTYSQFTDFRWTCPALE